MASSTPLPLSIFSTDCLFKVSQKSDCEEEDLLKDAMTTPDDPSSTSECKDTALLIVSIARNEINKDEIEGIVAQMVESSKRIKSNAISCSYYLLL